MKGDEKREKKRSILGDTVAFLTSVRTTIFLLFFLAAASVVGTVIPQEKSIEEIARTSSAFVVRLVAILDLNNLYRSWWFLLLLILMALNLLACLIQRTPAILSEWNPAVRKKTFSLKRSTRRNFGQLKEALLQALAPLVGPPGEEATDGGKISFHWVKQRVHLLGFPLMHTAIIIILAGGLLGLLYGFKGHVEIPEGAEAGQFFLIPSNEAQSLPFTIAVDKFTLKRYPTGEPKEFRSDVRLIENGKVVKEGSILVNHPMSYKGISLYQSDYRLQGVNGVDFTIVEASGKNRSVTVKPDERFPIPGTKARMRLLSLDPGSSSRGAGVEVAIEVEGERPRRLSIFESDREPVSLGKVKIRFTGYDPMYATGLQIGYDPGSWVVWTGCIMLILGFFLILFTNYRHLTLTVRVKDDETTEVEVSGGSRRQRREFRQAVEEAVDSVMDKSRGEADL